MWIKTDFSLKIYPALLNFTLFALGSIRHAVRNILKIKIWCLKAHAYFYTFHNKHDDGWMGGRTI